MSTTSFVRSTGERSGPMRSAFAQSTATRTRSSASSGSSRSSPSSCMNAYSRGTAPWPQSSISASLPRLRNASVIASSEPSASPSGFSCVTTRKRSCARSVSATACRSVWLVVIVGGQLVDQLCHPHATLDREIVLERQFGSPLHPELAAEPRLEQPMRGLEPLERRAPLARVAEHAHVDGGDAQVGARDDAGDRHQADPRVLQLGQRLPHDLPHRL